MFSKYFELMTPILTYPQVLKLCDGEQADFSLLISFDLTIRPWDCLSYISH